MHRKKKKEKGSNIKESRGQAFGLYSQPRRKFEVMQQLRRGYAFELWGYSHQRNAEPNRPHKRTREDGETGADKPDIDTEPRNRMCSKRRAELQQPATGCVVRDEQSQCIQQTRKWSDKEVGS
jgi:hypothetical protein